MPNLQILDFRPAEISDKKIIRVWFYARHPQDNQLKRVVVKCNRYKSHGQNMAYARRIRNEINQKLYAGWSPFVEKQLRNAYITFEEAINAFLAEKERELRPDSLRSYRSYCSSLGDWVRKHKPKGFYVIAFTDVDAVHYLDTLYSRPRFTPRTFNNYRAFFLGFFAWLIAHKYVRDNPFAGIKKKKTGKKNRGMIEKETRHKIENHLREHNFPMLVICKLMFHCLMRPKEILMTRIANIHTEEQTIFVPGEVSKTHNPRTVTIPDALVADLKALNLERYPPHYYAFSVNLLPGKYLQNTRDLGRIWQRLRAELRLSKEEKLYSFRDSGITEDLRAGIPAIMVRDHADHSSLAITNIYTKHENPELHRIIKEQSADF